MPISRYQIRNEYNLADPELYKAADRDDPEAILEGVAMAGLIGVLRQLGDLAEFAAEIFHDLHEEVMATSARGHGLMLRVQQLEEEFPAIEKAFLSQTNHSSFASNGGLEWQANLQLDQNLVTRGDLPRFIMDSYEECRGPPRLFLLDKFDIAGAGACLKRYSDPSFFKTEYVSSGKIKEEQREKKVRKVKKKGFRLMNGETPELFSASDFSSQLQQVEADEPCDISRKAPIFGVKLKKRHLNESYNLNTKSYMAKVLETSLVDKNSISGNSLLSSNFKRRYSGSGDAVAEIHEIISEQLPAEPTQKEEVQGFAKATVDEVNNEPIDDRILGSLAKPIVEFEPEKKPSAISEVDSKDLVIDAYRSDDNASELENYVDALTTMESEMETDVESKVKHEIDAMKIPTHSLDSETIDEQLELRGQLSDSHSCEDSSASREWDNGFEGERPHHSNSDTLSNEEETLESCEIMSPEFHDLSSEIVQRNMEISETESTKCLAPSSTVIGDSKVASRMSDSGLSFDFSLAESTYNGTNISPRASNLTEISSENGGASGHESPSNLKGMNQKIDGGLPQSPGLLNPQSEEDVQPSGFYNSDCLKLVGSMIGADDTFSAHPVTAGDAKVYPFHLHFAAEGDTDHERVCGDYVEGDHHREVLNRELPESPKSVELVKNETSVKQHMAVPSDGSVLQDDYDSAPHVGDINVMFNGSFIHEERCAMSVENSVSSMNKMAELSDAHMAGIKAAAEPEDLDLDSNMFFKSCDPVELNFRSASVHVNKQSDVQVTANNCDGAVNSQDRCDLLGASQESVIDEHEQSTDLGPGGIVDVAGSDVCGSDSVAAQASHGETYASSPSHNLLADGVKDSRANLNEVQEQSSGLDAVNGTNIEAAAGEYNSILNISPEASSHQPSDVSKDGDIAFKAEGVDFPDQMYPPMVFPSEQLNPEPDPITGCMLDLTGQNERELHLNDSSEASYVEIEERADDPAARNDLLEAVVHDPCVDSGSIPETAGDHLDKIEACPSSEMEINLCKLEVTTLSTDEHLVSDVQNIPSIAINISGTVEGSPVLMLESCSADSDAESKAEFVDCVHNPIPVKDVQGKDFPSSESEVHVSSEKNDQEIEFDYTQHNHGNEAVEDASEDIHDLKIDMQVGATTSHEKIENLEPLKEIDRKSESVSMQQDAEAEVCQLGYSTGSGPETISSDQGSGQNPLASEECSMVHPKMGDILTPSEISNVMFGSKSFSESLTDQPCESVSPQQDPDADVSDVGSLICSVPLIPISDQGSGPITETMAELNTETSEEPNMEYPQNGDILKSSEISNPVFGSKPSSQRFYANDENRVSPSLQFVPQPEFVLEESSRKEEHNKSSDLRADEGQATERVDSCLTSETQLGPSNSSVGGSVDFSSTASVQPKPFIQLLQRHDFDNFESRANPFGSVLPFSNDIQREAAQHPLSNTGEMPPLPPLPPVQWRIVKLPQDCPPNREEAGPSSSLFPPFPSGEQKQPPEDSLTPGGANLDPTNPFLSISSVGDVGLVVSPSDIFAPESKEEEKNQNWSERQEFHPSNPFAPQVHEKHQNGSCNIEETINLPPHSFAVAPAVGGDGKHQLDAILEGHSVVAPTASTSPSNEDEKPDSKSLHPRRKDPLIEAVATHDRSKLRKVSERVRPEIKPKVDERDSLLEQIRTKSFNLKPAAATRPIVQGPKTNLNIVAILEKAHAIRQAFAGSDEDDDADVWSDT